ncbi:SAF domain-containing protein [Clostridium sp. KNHs205]|uniref:SAF domain-containing protein n=1 Tax=Clostridium sp. KNHs205 TaxID=1449050 RepID=UPI00051AD01A|nr:SAF domain-containing protein [Clostridium sp. KNHs205]
MSKRLKRPLSVKEIAKHIAAGLLCVILPAGIFTGYLKVKSIYEHRIEIMSEVLQQYTVTVYVASAEIKAGDIITGTTVTVTETLSGQDKKNFMSETDIGHKALVDIPAGTHILKNMIAEEAMGDSIREVEFSLNLAGENIKEGDYTDIRLRYPNGEDYIVVSKSCISRIDTVKGYLYLKLSPDEIHLMSSALVDCFLKSGTYLYTTKYIAASYQEPSFVTYTPNEDVLSLIQQDPNVLEAARDYLSEGKRAGLEERLETYYENYLSTQYEATDNNRNNKEAADAYQYITGKESTSEGIDYLEGDNGREEYQTDGSYEVEYAE